MHLTSKLLPDLYFSDITKVNGDVIDKYGIKGFILDIDNTLALHDDQVLPPHSGEWLRFIGERSIPAILLSNNGAKRVESFAKMIGLPFVCDAGKPAIRGYLKAAGMLGIEPSRVAVIGDQLFTDILGGNRAGMTTILVKPLGDEIYYYIKLKRILEKPFLKSYLKKKQIDTF